MADNRAGQTVMMGDDMTAPAVTEYQRRVGAANATESGADHSRIMDEVAAEYGLTPLELVNAVNFDEIMEAN